MKLIVGFVVLAGFPALALADGSPRFNCHLDEILPSAEESDPQVDALDFAREVTPCGEGTCLVPIDHLKSKLACRDLAVSFGDGDLGPTLDVTLWSYCGAATDPAKTQSETISMPAESKGFQLIAEWGGFITELKCKRD